MASWCFSMMRRKRGGCSSVVTPVVILLLGWTSCAWSWAPATTSRSSPRSWAPKRSSWRAPQLFAAAPARAVAGLEKKQMLLDAAVERVRLQQRNAFRESVAELESSKKDTDVSLEAFLASTDQTTFTAYAKTTQGVMRTQAIWGGVAAVAVSLLIRRRRMWPLGWSLPRWAALGLTLGLQAAYDSFKRTLSPRASDRFLFSQKHVASFTLEPRGKFRSSAPACALAAASASLAEEALFRGVLYQPLALLTREPIAAAALVALSFGAAHAVNVKEKGGQLGYALDATFFGLLLGLASAATRGGLLVPVVAHFAYNFACALSCLPKITKATEATRLQPSVAGGLNGAQHMDHSNGRPSSAEQTLTSMAPKPEQFDFGI